MVSEQNNLILSGKAAKEKQTISPLPVDIEYLDKMQLKCTATSASHMKALVKIQKVLLHYRLLSAYSPVL